MDAPAQTAPPPTTDQAAGFVLTASAGGTAAVAADADGVSPSSAARRLTNAILPSSHRSSNSISSGSDSGPSPANMRLASLPPFAASSDFLPSRHTAAVAAATASPGDRHHGAWYFAPQGPPADAAGLAVPPTTSDRTPTYSTNTFSARGSDISRDIDGGGSSNRVGDAIGAGVDITPRQPVSEDNAQAQAPVRSSGGGPRARKKKISHACIHCQVAHVVCDEGRPCSRCVKRGMADTCTDGIRKRAKYLLEDDLSQTSLQGTPETLSGSKAPADTLAHELESIEDVELLPHSAVGSASTTMPQPPSDQLLHHHHSAVHAPATTGGGGGSGGGTHHGFGSETINLEYSVLSRMLDDPSTLLSFDPATLAIYNAVAAAASASTSSSSASASSSSSTTSPAAVVTAAATASSPSAAAVAAAAAAAAAAVSSASVSPAANPTATVASPSLPLASTGNHAPGEPGWSTALGWAAGHPSATAATAEAVAAIAASSGHTAAPLPAHHHAAHGGSSGGGSGGHQRQRRQILHRAGNDAARRAAIRDVYARVTEPYDYVSGYHFVVKYVKERFNKKDTIRILRALLQFRPSFMAQIVSLSYEDLIFMEKCFQRTLLEYEKLIDSSGTPTIVWRRTGELALVGKEFSLLTQWTREQLLRGPRRLFVFELMDDASALAYWDRFASLSLDGSQQSCQLTAVLLSPSFRPVPCSYCFTIKRDIFDMPLAIIGNFLPLFEAR
ncbi:Transcriptional regulator of nonfermentable carbon utilization [Cladochytrium tenue]|nr:Transcriptional regulator of nonfermentable carbon utilization [Cladochytrium tenue]